MNKTAEWWLRGYEPRTDIGTFAWVQAIIDDARAGMVPEGECTHVGKRKELWFRLREKLNNMAIDHEHEREDLKAKHEAELAKAWEAGRDAAATKVDNWNGDGEDNPRRLPATGSMIRALQPPGGKAK